MALWRINLKPEGKTGIDVASFCIERQILGVGWGLTERPTSKDDYWRIGKKQYDGSGWNKAINAVMNRVAVNDLVWTRNKQAIYFLGRVTGEWQYHDEPEFVDADVRNIRKCEWFEVGTMEHVPGKILNSFRPSATIQKVDDDTTEEFSRFLFNRLIGTESYALAPKTDSDIFSLLSPEDVEDIVGLYLQLEAGYVMHSSTCKSDTPQFEYELVSKDASRRAFVQVKTGNVTISIDDYPLREGTWYFFSPAEAYAGASHGKNVVRLSRKVIKAFLFDHEPLMLARIRTWIDYVRHGNR